jgi:hypothetical protein
MSFAPRPLQLRRKEPQWQLGRRPAELQSRKGGGGEKCLFLRGVEHDSPVYVT